MFLDRKKLAAWKRAPYWELITIVSLSNIFYYFWVLQWVPNMRFELRLRAIWQRRYAPASSAESDVSLPVRPVFSQMMNDSHAWTMGWVMPASEIAALGLGWKMMVLSIDAPLQLGTSRPPNGDMKRVSLLPEMWIRWKKCADMIVGLDLFSTNVGNMNSAKKLWMQEIMLTLGQS